MLGILHGNVQVHVKTNLQAAYIIKAFQFLWEGILKEYRISSKLHRLQGHSAKCLHESIYTLRSFNHVAQIGRQHFIIHTFRTFKFLSWCHLPDIQELDKQFMRDSLYVSKIKEKPS